MEAENGVVAFAETIANQVHEDIEGAVGSGELPAGTTESVGAHKQLVAMHIIDGFRSNDHTVDLDYEYIEIVARHASENAIAN